MSETVFIPAVEKKRHNLPTARRSTQRQPRPGEQHKAQVTRWGAVCQECTGEGCNRGGICGGLGACLYHHPVPLRMRAPPSRPVAHSPTNTPAHVSAHAPICTPTHSTAYAHVCTPEFIHAMPLPAPLQVYY